MFFFFSAVQETCDWFAANYDSARKWRSLHLIGCGEFEQQKADWSNNFNNKILFIYLIIFRFKKKKIIKCLNILSKS